MTKRNPSFIVNSVQDLFKDIKRIPRNIVHLNRWFTALNPIEKTILVMGTMVVAYGSIYAGIKYKEYLVAEEIKACKYWLTRDYSHAYGNEELRQQIAKGEYDSCVDEIIYRDF